MSKSSSFVPRGNGWVKVGSALAKFGPSHETSFSVLISRMAEAGDSTTTDGSKSISLVDILDNDAEEIGSRELVGEDEHGDDDENGLPPKPEREGFCVECEGESFIPRPTMPGVLSALFSCRREQC